MPDFCGQMTLQKLRAIAFNQPPHFLSSTKNMKRNGTRIVVRAGKVTIAPGSVDTYRQVLIQNGTKIGLSEGHRER